MNSYSYLSIKNILANKSIYNIEVFQPLDQQYNFDGINDMDLKLVIYLRDRVSSTYDHLYNTYILTCYVNNKYYKYNKLLCLQTLNDEPLDYKVLIGKTIRSIYRIITKRYRLVKIDYLLETTDGIKYKLRTELIMLRYNIIKITRTTDNPMTKLLG